MSDASSIKLIDGATEEGDAKRGVGDARSGRPN